MEELLAALIEYAKPDYEPEQDAFLLNLLNDALEEVCNEMYPHGFKTDNEEQKIKSMALKKYKSKIRRIAEYHFDKQGRESVISWSENGSSVSYDSAGTPSVFLRGIIPVAKIV